VQQGARGIEGFGLVSVPPPLDVHAHVSAEITRNDLAELGAFIFAMTRTLDEFDSVRLRQDRRTVWGVGVHPGLVKAHKQFDAQRFSEALDHSPVVGEIGLDSSSRVPMSIQLRTFRSALRELQLKPRVVSIHSSGAQIHVLRELLRTPIDGVILHWWTGSVELTEEAVRLGCYFSFPPASMSSTELLSSIPLSRLLAETDHPFGDRYGPKERKPGNVREVEERLGELANRRRFDMRGIFWRNFCSLVEEAGVAAMFNEVWLTEIQKTSLRP